MEFCSLSSGSSGNALVVGEEGRYFLVDCGISANRVTACLAQVQIPVSQIEGIVVTHEHSDHILGVGALARRLRIPVYAGDLVWEAMEKPLGRLTGDQKRTVIDKASVAGMHVDFFATSHDCRQGKGIRVTGRFGTLGVLTDTGMLTERMHQVLTGCTCIVIEANHDLDRLWRGSYPQSLKKRVAGVCGHLSNVQAAEGLCRWVQSNTQRVVLAHLSEENNTPELALRTVCSILRDSPVKRRCPRLKIRVAPRYGPHELITMEDPGMNGSIAATEDSMALGKEA
ncbi:MAG: MBL fold metallo-hydrolase [Peptococcaceae bacterium]|nr:MBL fold metallo-hydrolase [Peptococcaceae bacterium]